MVYVRFIRLDAVRVKSLLFETLFQFRPSHLLWPETEYIVCAIRLPRGDSLFIRLFEDERAIASLVVS